MSKQPDALTFWNLRDARDYPLLLELNRSSRQADGDPAPITLEAIADVLAHMDGLSQEQGVILTSVGDTPIGYSRLGWYSSRPQTRLCYQISFIIPEKRALWAALIAENERRLRAVAAGHAPVAEHYFQAWASDQQRDWKAALEKSGYQVVRRFNNMLYDLGDAPDKPMPAGLEIRPVLPEHMRSIWAAQKEMNAGLFENVAEDWLDEQYPTWLANPENNPRFWQVAWDGDQVAGMVLAHMDEKKNEKQHGYTEHIYVRPQWRGRGLASALIARSLQVLKEQGAS